MSPARLRPADWQWALRAGIESAALCWLTVVMVTVLVYLSTSSLDATAALATGDAVRTGTALWSLALGGSLGSPQDDYGVVTLPMTGVTVLQAVWTWRCVGRASLQGPLSGAWTLAATLVVAVLAVLTGPADSRTWPAALGLMVMTAVVVAVRLQREGRGSRRLSAWWELRPNWVTPGLSLARGAVVALSVLTAVVMVAAAVSGAGVVAGLHREVAGGGVADSLGLVLLQAGWLPTVCVWACSWLVGAGFTVGQGSIVSPEHVSADAPSVPLLGLLPTAPLGTVGLYLPLVVTAGAMVVAWRRRSVLSSLRVRYAVAASLLAGVLLALGVGAACLAASGSIGPGRMTEVGPRVVYTVFLVFLEVSVGLGAVAVLAHPYTRTWASEAVSGTTTQAASALRRERGGRFRPAGDQDSGDGTGGT